MPSCPRTLLTLIALMVVVQCCTFLLSKLLRRTAIWARASLRSRGLSLSKRPRFGRKSPLTAEPALWFPEGVNGTLVFDHAPRDRSGMETPAGGFNMEALIEDMQSITSNLASMTATPNPVFPFTEYYGDHFSFVASPDGVVRTEYAPLPGSTIPNGTVADVIDIHRRRS